LSSALALEIDNTERIDYSISNAEACRNAVLREIDRRRATFGQALRGAAQEVEEAEFKTVDSKAITLQKGSNKVSN
jgi:hypothetical protein